MLKLEKLEKPVVPAVSIVRGAESPWWACRSVRQAPPLTVSWRTHEDRSTQAERGAVPGLHRRHLPAAKRRRRTTWCCARPRRSPASSWTRSPPARPSPTSRAERGDRGAGGGRGGRGRIGTDAAGLVWPSCSATTVSCTTSATRRRPARAPSTCSSRCATRPWWCSARAGSGRGPWRDSRAPAWAHRRGGRRHDRAEQPQPPGPLPDSDWAGARWTWPPNRSAR